MDKDIIKCIGRSNLLPPKKVFKVTCNLHYMKRVLSSIICLLILGISHSQVVINEFSASNYTNWNTAGEFEDWIELYNPTAATIDISGYFLSDNILNPTKYEIPGGTSIPANGRVVFLCSGLAGIDDNFGGYANTNFKLTQTNSEEVVFSDNSGTIIDSYEFAVIGPTQANHSWGRDGDGSSNWVIYSTPTPDAPNTGTTAIGYATKPVFNIEAGYYPNTQNITLTAGTGETIYYTTDGSAPSSSSTVYSGPIIVNSTEVIRAISYAGDPNILPSFVETNTYFINTDAHTIPVVAISGNTLSDGEWFGDEPTVIEYFDENGAFISEAHGESNEHGNDSNAYGQRGFDYITRDQKGYDNGLEGTFFAPHSDRSKFQRLIFKAAANDNYSFENGGAHVRDLYCHLLSEKAGLHLDERLGIYTILYINGEYWGVYDMREKADDLDYTRYYYNQGQGFVDFIKTWGWTWADYGSANDWDNLVTFITTNDMTDAANYSYVQSELNTNSLIDYFILNSYVVTADWLNWNTAWWRGRNPDGDHKKWGYVLWDMDATFDHYINYTGVPDQGPGADPCNPEVLGDPGDQGHVPVLNALFENEDFQADYINRYASLSNTYFSCDYMVGLLDSLENVITPEMQRQIDRWGGGSLAGWQANVQAMRDFIEERCADEIIGGIEDCYDVEAFTITIEIVGDGTVEASTVTINPTDSPWSGIFFSDQNIPFSAIDGNDNFITWQIVSGDITLADLTNPNIEFILTGDVSLIAFFDPPQPQEVTFLVDPIGSGTINVNTSDLSTYPTTLTLPFGANDLIATPIQWFEFDHWQTNNNTLSPDNVTNEVILTVSQTDTVIAVFNAIDHYVVNIDNNYLIDGSDGEITVDNVTINPNTWSADVAAGSVITLVANTDNEWAVFDHWEVTGNITISGDPNDPNGTFTINGEGTIIPVFTILPHYNITVSVQPPGAGTVQMNGNTLEPLPYSQVMAGDVDIPFTAIPNGDEWTTFSHWVVQSATLLPATTSENITARFNQEDQLIAIFEVVPHYEVTVIVKPSRGGAVNIANTTRVTNTWTGELEGNTPISFSAIPEEYYTFTHWESTSAIPASPSDQELNVSFTFTENDTIIAYLPQDDETMFIPTGFTPNGDGINDRFTPLAYAFDMETYKLSIFDRWGTKIFETSDYTKGWDGSRFHGGYYVPDGVYIYSLDIKRISDPEVKNYTGNITITR